MFSPAGGCVGLVLQAVGEEETEAEAEGVDDGTGVDEGIGVDAREGSTFIYRSSL